MLVSVAAVGALALWEEAREAKAELQDLADAQSTLASVAGSALATHLATARRDAEAIATESARGRELPDAIRGGYTTLRVRRVDEPASQAPSGIGPLATFAVPVPGGRLVDVQIPLSRLVPGIRTLGRDSTVLLLVPHERRLRGLHGEVIRSPRLLEALDGARTWCDLARDDAASIGLPSRLAIAGLAVVRAGDLGDWGVVVATSARKERDRQHQARLRLVVGVVLMASMVVAFGGVALRTLRKELELEGALAAVGVQRERDEQLAREGRAAMMVTLAAGVAHEIATPLNVIAGRAEQLAERTSDERSRRVAQVIAQQAGRISDVMRGFLRLARGDALALENVDPDAVARAALALVSHRFEKAGVAIHRSGPVALPMIRGDERLLEQALVNLLLNACDACERGGHVELNVDRDEAGVRFAVLDDGSGISPADAARVVEPFFTTKPMDKGTGLGLAITNEIVAIHRGTLHLDPRVPRGTVAAFIIPVEHGEIDDRT